ncbi:MAG: fibronectin type III domain-containing protein [Bacteroidota bacterium]
MKKNKVVFDFQRFSVAEKIAFGRTVVSMMSDLDIFKEPDVAYAVLTELINRLEGHYMASRGGDHEQVALMHKDEDEFNNLFRKLAGFVDRKADGDEAIIISSGFHLNKQPVSAELPEFVASMGDNPGSVWLKRKKLEGAASYIWQYSASEAVPADGGWLFGGASTQTNYQITGLPSVTRHWFRVAAVTREGIQPYSEPVQQIVP